MLLITPIPTSFKTFYDSDYHQLLYFDDASSDTTPPPIGIVITAVVIAAFIIRSYNIINRDDLVGG